MNRKFEKRKIILDVFDLVTVTLCGDDVQSFDKKWDEVALSTEGTRRTPF